MKYNSTSKLACKIYYCATTLLLLRKPFKEKNTSVPRVLLQCFSKNKCARVMIVLCIAAIVKS